MQVLVPLFCGPIPVGEEKGGNDTQCKEFRLWRQKDLGPNPASPLTPV